MSVMPTGELPVIEDAPPAGAPSVDISAVRERAWARWQMTMTSAGAVDRVLPPTEPLAPPALDPFGQLVERVDDIVDRLIRLEALHAADRLDRSDILGQRVDEISRELVAVVDSVERRLRPRHAAGDASTGGADRVC